MPYRFLQNMTDASSQPGYVAAVDTDSIFQLDPFDAIHPHVSTRDGRQLGERPLYMHALIKLCVCYRCAASTSSSSPPRIQSTITAAALR